MEMKSKLKHTQKKEHNL